MQPADRGRRLNPHDDLRGNPHDRRHALVTGASSGIGAAISRRLLDEGFRVTGIARDFAKLNLGLDSKDESFSAINLDLSRLDRLGPELDALARRLPDVDAVIQCAGRGLIGGLEEQSYQQIRELIDLDFTAQVYVARAFLPTLKRHDRSDLVFLGSEAALAGGRRGAVYCGSKFALRGFAQALRQECARSGVRVIQIHPGMVRTPFFDNLPIEPGPASENALDATDVAETVAMALTLPATAVADEIVLSPLKSVVQRKR